MNPVNIMLLDDALFNHSSFAFAGLAGHNVTAFSEVELANDWLLQQKVDDIDVGLLDCWMPTPAPRGDSEYARRATDLHAGDDLPVGLAFAIRLWNFRIPSAVCTDSFHHSDRIVHFVNAKNRASPLGIGFGGIVIFEAAHFSVPGVRFVLDHPSTTTGTICRVRECRIGTGSESVLGYQVFSIYDVACTQVLRTVPVGETRPIKDWGRVLECRLSMPLVPPAAKTGGLVLAEH